MSHVWSISRGKSLRGILITCLYHNSFGCTGSTSNSFQPLVSKISYNNSNLMTIGESWNVDEWVKHDLYLLPQCLIHYNRPEHALISAKSWSISSSRAPSCHHLWTRLKNAWTLLLEGKTVHTEQFTIFRLRTMTSELNELLFISAASYWAANHSSGPDGPGRHKQNDIICKKQRWDTELPKLSYPSLCNWQILNWSPSSCLLIYEPNFNS